MDTILKTIKSTKAWIRQAGVNTPNLNRYVAYAATRGLERVAPGYGFKLLITFFQEKGDKTYWIFTGDHTNAVAQKILGNPRVAYRLYRIWKTRVKKYYHFVGKLLKYGIKNLEKEFTEFEKLYLSEYAAAMITDYITIILSDQVFQDLLKKYGQENRELIQKILLPQQRTFMNEEELSALKVGLLIKEKVDPAKFNTITLEELKELFPEIYEAIQKHQQRFFWVQVNYKYTDPVTVEKFLETIRETVVNLNLVQIRAKIERLENYAQNLREEKQKIYNQLKINQTDRKSAALISLNGYWHDARKQANLVGNFTANEFLARIGRKYQYPQEELQFTLPQEVKKLFAGEKLDRNLLQRRMQSSVHIIGAKLAEYILEEEEARQIVEMTQRPREEKLTDLRGTPASYGIAQGKVRIIHNPKKQDIEEGEILVTSMTRPDFAPLMKKAAAIITEEGGITSHAAIISRELEKPCIVGTRIASQVLKDGDEVEVNANHGLIKILKPRNS